MYDCSTARAAEEQELQQTLEKLKARIEELEKEKSSEEALQCGCACVCSVRVFVCHF